MPTYATLPEPELERQGRRLSAPAARFVSISAILGVPGLLLFLFAHSWVAALGIALVAVAVPPLTVGLGLLVTAIVARWSARHKPFA